MTDVPADTRDPDERQGDPQAPQSTFTRRQIIAFVAFAVLAIALLYGLVPQLAGLDDTWQRIKHGDPRWLAVAPVLEIIGYFAYVALFRGVFSRDGIHLGWRASYQITLAGLAATRLLAAGGAGGVALTVWALRRAGLPAQRVATGMTAFLVLLYAVFMLALLFFGVGLRTGVLPGPAPFALTVVPAVFAAIAIAIALAMTLVPHDLTGRVFHQPAASRRGRVARWLTAVPATIGDGVRHALELVRTKDPRLLGAVLWWAFDVSVLAVCLHAFGASPPLAVIVMAYFVGMIANLLPLPGGIGGVDGGMIGALIAFDVDSGAALVAVLSYRFFAFWLPTIPGAIAYFFLVRTVRHWQEDDRPVAHVTAGCR